MSASALTAYLLVSHGSRDPRPGQAMERLAHFVRSPETELPDFHNDRSGDIEDPSGSWAERSNRSAPEQLVGGQAAPLLRRVFTPDGLRPGGLALNEPGILGSRASLPQTVSGPLVGTACLEVGTVPLHQQIIAFSRRARAAGAQRLRVVPLFLLAGVHVMDDIPAEIEQARQGLPDLTLELCPHLGSHPGIEGLLRQQLRATAAETLVLLAHGSRRPGGNAPIAALARSLGGSAAFWAVAPSLESEVIRHRQSGVQRVAILPYFLFAGSTTDAITHLTEELAERFPQMGFDLLPPLGPSVELARLVVELALDRVPAHAQHALLPMQRMAFRHAIQPSSMVS